MELRLQLMVPHTEFPQNDFRTGLYFIMHEE